MNESTSAPAAVKGFHPLAVLRLAVPAKPPSRQVPVGVVAMLAAFVVPAVPAPAAAGFDGTYRVALTADALRAVGTRAGIAVADTGVEACGRPWSLVAAPDGRHLWQLARPRRCGSQGRLALFTTRTVDGYPHHVEVGTLRWQRQPSGLRFAIVGAQREDLAGMLAARPWQTVS